MPVATSELEGWPGKLGRDAITQLALHVPFDETAAAFDSSDETLDAVWEFAMADITWAGTAMPYAKVVVFSRLTRLLLRAGRLTLKASGSTT